MKPRQPVQQQGANSVSVTWKMRDRINMNVLTPSCRLVWQEGVLFFRLFVNVVVVYDGTKNCQYCIDAGAPRRSLSL
jgi:hypothetical protein